MWKESRNGSTRYKDRIADPMTGKKHTISVTLPGKYSRIQEREARALLDARIDDLLSGKESDPNDPTLKEVAEHYFADQRRTVSEQTCIRNYHAVNTLMKMLGEDVRINKLTARYVREMFSASGKKNGTLNEHLVRLKAFLRWAYRNDYLADVSWLDKLIPYPDEASKEELEYKYLEPDQLDKLLDAMTVEHWRNVTEFMALTGMRAGEALGLQTSDVDFGNRTIRVCHSLSSVTGTLGETKTRRQREVYMQDELLKLCRRLDLERKKRDLTTGVRSTYFFSAPDGSPLEYYAFNKYLREIASNVLDRDHKTTTHILRHTHVALMAENGVSLDAISRRVGHSNSRITRDIYFHVTKKMKERDNAEFEQVTLLAK